MVIISKNVDASLLEVLRALKGDYTGGQYALHFHLSGLHENYKSEFQLKIAANILNDVFRDNEGSIFTARDADIFVIYLGDDRNLLDKAVFQLRYLFADDQLAYNIDGTENDNFCTMYDLSFQWRLLHRLAIERMEVAAQTELSFSHGELPQERKDLLTPSRLAQLEMELRDLDIEIAIRKQPVCAIKPEKNSPNGYNVRPVYNEIYVNIASLRRLFAKDCDILSERSLFKYFTWVLDKKVMEIIEGRIKFYTSEPFSLNLNVKTILSKEFMKFHEIIKKEMKTSLVVEVQIEDVFADMNSFMAAKNLVQEKGQRICVDGLNNAGFIQVDRNRLGFDLAKLQWNADMAGDLGSSENKKLAEAVKQCGAGRIILCRCDTKHAIEYGHALGISLFQGRYPDRIIDPNKVILN